MSIYQYQGVVTALTSISHIGETRGITSLLRREKVINSAGDGFEEVPIISGNSVRGRLRDLGMAHMCRALGYGVRENEKGEIEVSGLSLPAFYFLFSGGSLTKEGGKALDVDAAREFRNLIPLVSIFGSAVGNMIMDGKLLGGKFIPICSEVAHLLPERFVQEKQSLDAVVQRVYLEPPLEALAKIIAEIVYQDATTRGKRVIYEHIDREYFMNLLAEYDKRIRFWVKNLEYGNIAELFESVQPYLQDAFKKQDVYEYRSKKLLSIWNMIQQESYTRKDDEKNESLRQLIDPNDRKLLEAKNSVKRDKQKSGDDVDTEIGKHQQMRYHVETFAAGTRFFTEFILKDPTDIEYESFMITLLEFSRMPFIGGKSAVGHGKIKMQFDKWAEINPNLSLSGTEVDKPIGDRYMEHLKARGSEIKSILAKIA